MSCSPSTMSEKKKNTGLPELLAPAGSRASLEAAIEGGADAVYLGGAFFNARAGAENFGEDALSAAVALAHAHGVKVYFTLNTLIFDRELPDVIGAAESAYFAGADALIVADLGLAAVLQRLMPGLALHASTQASGHGGAAGETLSRLGFSRMVCAREMSLEDIRSFTAKSPIEAEVFVHGALCVSHSGQCLFSSIVGGRSGNRGECAQPCRLPYHSAGRGDKYPLSLKDLCLACHIPALIDAGVSSLKIEGRMKSPEYVLAVSSLWRRLLDERRGANGEEMEYLASVFSRGGFTDAYFTGRVGEGMLGVRGETDKESSRALPPFGGITNKIPLDMEAEILAGKPMRLTVRAGELSATVCGAVPEPAERRSADEESVTRNLSKLGQTPYSPGRISLTLGEGLSVPLSALNALRRDAVAGLSLTGRERDIVGVYKRPDKKADTPADRSPRPLKTVSFYSAAGIPDEAFDYFDILYLPLRETRGADTPPLGAGRGAEIGIILPPVIFDSELEATGKALASAAASGIRHALIGNIGHIGLAGKFGFTPHGDFRLNITNGETAAIYRALGLADLLLSPELTLPQARDIAGGGMIVYGRIPLMLLERCAAREVSGCGVCQAGGAVLTDRRGITFPVLREIPHRNIVYNSLPTSMADRQDELSRHRITHWHFIFSTESRREAADVIFDFKSHRPPGYPVRRIQRGTR